MKLVVVVCVCVSVCTCMRMCDCPNTCGENSQLISRNNYIPHIRSALLIGVKYGVVGLSVSSADLPINRNPCTYYLQK